MKNLSNSSFIKIIIKLLFLMLVAKIIGVVSLWFLPAQSQELHQNSRKTIPYRRVDFHNLIEGNVMKRTARVTTHRQSAASIHDMILHGLYGNSSFGYAIVATKASPRKTEIISIGEKYRGYRLKRIALNYVVFEKGHKEYVLNLEKSKTTTSMDRRVHQIQQRNGEDESIDVSRNEIQYYEKNPSQIWHDVSIMEIKKDGKINGFKVMKIRKHSKIAALGLHRGDIIMKANGMPLTSYNAAFKIYNDINKLESLSLLIKRGNEEKELIYEIH
jgi:general secretion pathway protein C